MTSNDFYVLGYQLLFPVAYFRRENLGKGNCDGKLRESKYNIQTCRVSYGNEKFDILKLCKVHLDSTDLLGLD